MASFVIQSSPIHVKRIRISAQVSSTRAVSITQSKYLLAPAVKGVPSLYSSSAARVAQAPQTAWDGGGSTWDNNGRGWGGNGRNWDDAREEGNDNTANNWLKVVLTYLMQLATKYNACLSTHPLLTKSLTASFLVALSDIIAQALSSTSTDYARTARYALYGLLSVGPQGHFWFSFLERLVTLPGAFGVATKVLVDQILFSPVSTAIFFVTMKIAEGWSIQHAWDFVRENLVSTMRMSYQIWPAVNVLNFWIVPVQYRLMFVSTISVGWVAFLSLVSGKCQREKGVEG